MECGWGNVQTSWGVTGAKKGGNNGAPITVSGVEESAHRKNGEQLLAKGLMYHLLRTILKALSSIPWAIVLTLIPTDSPVISSTRGLL